MVGSGGRDQGPSTRSRWRIRFCCRWADEVRWGVPPLTVVLPALQVVHGSRRRAWSGRRSGGTVDLADVVRNPGPDLPEPTGRRRFARTFATPWVDLARPGSHIIAWTDVIDAIVPVQLIWGALGTR